MNPPREPFQERCQIILDHFNTELEDLRLLYSTRGLFAYIFKEIFPYFMRSRFAEWAHHKPKRVLRRFPDDGDDLTNRPQGDGRLGTGGPMVPEHFGRPVVRGRRGLLKKLLEQEALRGLSTRDHAHPQSGLRLLPGII